jgi:hypothetical protein
VVVLANPSDTAITERVMIANAGLMDGTLMVDLFSPADTPAVGTVDAAFMTVTVPPETVFILVPRERFLGGYSRYKWIP